MLMESIEKVITIKQKDLLKLVLYSALHLSNLIDDALDLSRIENNKFQLNMEYFNIRTVLSDVCEIMSFQFQQKALEFSTKVYRSVPQLIYSDAKRLKQVLFNLLGNAVKFTFIGFV